MRESLHISTVQYAQASCAHWLEVFTTSMLTLITIWNQNWLFPSLQIGYFLRFSQSKFLHINTQNIILNKIILSGVFKSRCRNWTDACYVIASSSDSSESEVKNRTIIVWFRYSYPRWRIDKEAVKLYSDGKNMIKLLWNLRYHHQAFTFITAWIIQTAHYSLSETLRFSRSFKHNMHVTCLALVQMINKMGKVDLPEKMGLIKVKVEIKRKLRDLEWWTTNCCHKRA